MPEAKKRSFGMPCLVVLLVLVALVAMGGCFLAGVAKVVDGTTGRGGSLSSSGWIPGIEERVLVPGSQRKVAQIDLVGIITNQARPGGMSMVEEFQQLMRKALEDDKVVAVVVRIQSPGGEVTASDLLHRAVKSVDARKPVIAYLDGVAASGGYYAACGARKLVAHPTTITGSIGVILQSVQYHELMDKIGMGVEVYKSGKFKDILSGSRAPTEEERAYLQAMIRQSYERFLAVVAESRKKPAAQLRDSTAADGRVYSGADALEMGMVDGNGYLDDAYAEARTAAGVADASVVRYRISHGLMDVIGLLGASATGHEKIQLDVFGGTMPVLQPGMLYYIHLPGAAQP